MWVRLLLLSFLAPLGAMGCTESPDSDPAPGTCDSEVFRISAVHLPHTGGEAADLGFDLDGDRVIDNQLGALTAALAAIYPAWDPETWLSDRLAEGDVQWLARIDSCEGSPAWSARLMRAEDADADGRPEILDDGVPASGDGTIALGGIALVPVGYFADGGGIAVSAAWEDAPAFHISTRDAAAGLQLTLGLAVPLGDAALAPAAAFLTAELARGSLFARTLDTNGDDIISVAELRASPAITTLLAADIDTDGDAIADAISIGFSATAVPVRLDD